MAATTSIGFCVIALRWHGQRRGVGVRKHHARLTECVFPFGMVTTNTSSERYVQQHSIAAITCAHSKINYVERRLQFDH